jgi:hypothetical protein
MQPQMKVLVLIPALCVAGALAHATTMESPAQDHGHRAGECVTDVDKRGDHAMSFHTKSPFITSFFSATGGPHQSRHHG